MPLTTTGSTLLIVDDTPDNIAVLFDYLAEAGHRVLGCESGAAALETLEIEEPDLILLDVMMPELDGFETCRRIKQIPAGRDVPVFFMTALDDPIDKVRGLEAGAIDYLTKPVFPEEVLKRVQAHLEIRRLRKTLQEQNDRLDAALQRSITAENHLRETLNQALLILHRPSLKVLFATRQATALLAAPSDLDHLREATRQNQPTVRTQAGLDYELDYGAEDPTAGTLLLTLRPCRQPPTPADLRALGLTPRETEILFWVAQGKTSPEIAIILRMQVCTVKKHVENFLPKLGVETRLAAALQAQELLKTV